MQITFSGNGVYSWVLLYHLWLYFSAFIFPISLCFSDCNIKFYRKISWIAEGLRQIAKYQSKFVIMMKLFLVTFWTCEFRNIYYSLFSDLAFTPWMNCVFESTQQHFKSVSLFIQPFHKFKWSKHRWTINNTYKFCKQISFHFPLTQTMSVLFRLLNYRSPFCQSFVRPKWKAFIL